MNANKFIAELEKHIAILDTDKSKNSVMAQTTILTLRAVINAAKASEYTPNNNNAYDLSKIGGLPGLLKKG